MERISQDTLAAQANPPLPARARRKAKERPLTRAAFDRLLACLDPDRDRASARYLKLRKALVSFFAFRGADSPLELADDTMNRVARRLDEGKQITTANPASYVFAVARNVWRETLAKPFVMVPLAENLAFERACASDPDALMRQAGDRADLDARLERLDQCLRRLSSEDRELIVDYYQSSGCAKIENRQALAARRGIAVKTLRNRVCRLRSWIAEQMIER